MEIGKEIEMRILAGTLSPVSEVETKAGCDIILLVVPGTLTLLRGTTNKAIQTQAFASQKTKQQ